MTQLTKEFFELTVPSEKAHTYIEYILDDVIWQCTKDGYVDVLKCFDWELPDTMEIPENLTTLYSVILPTYVKIEKLDEIIVCKADAVNEVGLRVLMKSFFEAIRLKDSEDKKLFIQDLAYIMLDDVSGHVKIGKSKHPNYRKKQLETSLSRDLIILLVTNRFTEYELHQKFNHLRVRREWFIYGEEIINFVIAQNRRQHKDN